MPVPGQNGWPSHSIQRLIRQGVGCSWSRFSGFSPQFEVFSPFISTWVLVLESLAWLRLQCHHSLILCAQVYILLFSYLLAWPDRGQLQGTGLFLEESFKVSSIIGWGQGWELWEQRQFGKVPSQSWAPRLDNWGCHGMSVTQPSCGTSGEVQVHSPTMNPNKERSWIIVFFRGRGVPS